MDKKTYIDIDNSTAELLVIQSGYCAVSIDLAELMHLIHLHTEIESTCLLHSSVIANLKAVSKTA